MANRTPGAGTLTDLEYAKIIGRERMEAGLARGASTFADLIFGAKKLAKAQDMKDRQAALDELGKLDQTV